MQENTRKRFEFPGEEEKGKQYLTNINSICKACGYRNVGSYKLDEDMPVVCCGKCGEFIIIPEGMSEIDKESIQLCVKQALIEQAEE